jgi:hypothetical protein
MTDYSDWKIKKSELDEKLDEYSQVAEWCNDSGEYTITEDSGYYKVAAVGQPSEDELKEAVRNIRNQYLLDTDFTQLSDVPFTSEEKAQYEAYRQYLRDYTSQEEWWARNPYNFEEWCNSAHPVEE